MMGYLFDKNLTEGYTFSGILKQKSALETLICTRVEYFKQSCFVFEQKKCPGPSNSLQKVGLGPSLIQICGLGAMSPKHVFFFGRSGTRLIFFTNRAQYLSIAECIKKEIYLSNVQPYFGDFKNA